MLKKVLLFSFYLTCMLMAEGKRLSFDEVMDKSTFKRASLGQYVWLPDQDAYVIRGKGLKSKSLYRYDLISGDTTLFLDSTAFLYQGQILKVQTYKFDKAGRQLLLQTNRKKGWRRSYSGTYYILNLATREVSPVSQDPHHLRNIKFSPDGEKIAYVRTDNNIYVFKIKRNKEKRLTKNGSETILNGHWGWVYEEEFGSYDGYRWSPDSESIAYWEEDQAQVPEFILVDELGLYPTTKKIRYPKAGQTNPTMRIAVVRVKSGRRKWMDIGNNSDTYFPWMEWNNERELTIMRMNRLQKKWEFLNTSVTTGRSNPGLSEEDPAGWVDLHRDYRFIKNGKILWISERSGFQHLYIHHASGRMEKQLTNGNWEVTKIVHVDETNQKVYFMSNREGVTERRFYSVDYEGANLQLLTRESGYHNITITPSGNYFIDSFSSIDQPTQIILKAMNGDTIRILQETDRQQYDEYEWSYPQFVQFKTEDGTKTLDGIITLPPDYNKDKRYPVIVHGYGMPGTQMVWNRWGSTWNQYLAQNGFIVFSMDTRGMSGRGEEFKNLSYGNMAKYLAQDHIAGVEWLVDAGYADRDRIGAWGWSGGGYFTGLMLTKNGNYFKTGVAVAPVMDFRLYDTIYTERSMGLPQDNAAGYDSTSVLSYAARLKGKLLVIHGTGDDNVHSQNTVQLVEAFVKANKPLDIFLYPNRNHGMSGGNARKHLYAKMFNYFKDNL